MMIVKRMKSMNTKVGRSDQTLNGRRSEAKGQCTMQSIDGGEGEA